MKKIWETIKTFVKEKVLEPAEDFFVGLWNDFLELVAKPWFKIRSWILRTALPWLAKGWYQIVNMLVLFIAYGHIDEVAQPGLSNIVGLWLFILLAYYIFWKLFGFDKVYKKMREDRKKKKITKH